jgi:hypothetical protein
VKRWEIDGTGSGLYPMADFGVTGAEPSSSATTDKLSASLIPGIPTALPHRIRGLYVLSSVFSFWKKELSDIMGLFFFLSNKIRKLFFLLEQSGSFLWNKVVPSLGIRRLD